MVTASDYDVTTTSSAGAAAVVLYVRTETRAERIRRTSNEDADKAMEMGLMGEEALSAMWAEMADQMAELAGIVEALERI